MTTSPVLGELHGVRGEVEQHLPKARRISAQGQGELGRAVGQQLEALAPCRLRDQLGRFLDDLDKGEVDGVELELAGLVLREVEDVVDDAEQRLPGQVDPVHVLPLTLVERRVLQQAGEPDHPVHRCTDLMAHRGQERRLGPRRLQRGVPARAGLGPRPTLRLQKVRTAGKAEPQQDGHTDQGGQDVSLAAPEVFHEVQRERNQDRYGRDGQPRQNGRPGRASSATGSAAAPGRRQAEVVISIAPSIQPASRNG